MSTQFFFHYQRDGKESAWELALADERGSIVKHTRPAFVTALDLTSVPTDQDWSKVRYRGPFYADFDSDDLSEACDQFISFLVKLHEYGVGLEQCSLFATGGRGFHVEVPQEVFMPKPPPGGVSWLPYIYREMASAMVVDTMDMRVYTGKRGRMWRTPNVQRDNGAYKVALTTEEALSMTPELYEELCASPREAIVPEPPVVNSRLVALFESGKSKIQAHMRGKKKRQEKANAILDPWKKSKKTPPSIEALMDGTGVNGEARFQELAMQLAIYATSVGMDKGVFLDRCRGLCENHVSDSSRYGTFKKRQDELARMYEYMQENSLYDFEVAPIKKLLKRGVTATDLGEIATEDEGDRPERIQEELDEEDEPGEERPAPTEDQHKGVRRGLVMNGDGMWRRSGDTIESICRATLRNVEAFYNVEGARDFKGYEFDIVVKGRKLTRTMLGSEAFVSSTPLKKFFAAHQLTFQGKDEDATGLIDIMAEKASRSGHTYVYPREGFMVLRHPDDDEPVKAYLTQDAFLMNIPEGDPRYFRLRYRPENAVSSYQLDIHKAPELDESMIPVIHDLFRFNKPEVVADLLGWFVAAHYRSAYLFLFSQFPMLQIYGEAGSGKTQTVLALSHLHWFREQNISVRSALSHTPFAIDTDASTSTSAPMIVDEWKPRELIKFRGKYEKWKDTMKASYVGSDIGVRGTLNKGAENSLGIIKSKATAPIVFMGESIEMETAIFERCISVQFSQAFLTKQRTEAFENLNANPQVLSAIGRMLIEMGFGIDLDAMKEDVKGIRKELEALLPDLEDGTKRRAAPRLIYNRAVGIHGLRILKYGLKRKFGPVFDEAINELLETRIGTNIDAETLVAPSTSEISKVLNRISLLARETEDVAWRMKLGKDYLSDGSWVELRVERSYDAYRLYCAQVRDTPLFDTVEAFLHALYAYSPCIDKHCASSELRSEGSGEHIVRLDSSRLNREGVQAFKGS
jgi:hypothetical protein